jgi:RHS repeat-associated protein
MRTILILLLAVAALPSIARGQTPPETIEYYATDMIGSIRIVFRPDGTTVARQDYAPFGRPLFPVPAMPAEAFGGNVKDDETDQAYFHARMFQARTGRFTRPDPIQAGVSEPQRWNRYAYGLNNPVAFTDASGLNACPDGYFCSGVTAHAPDDSFWLQMELWWYFGGGFGEWGGNSGSFDDGGGGGGGGGGVVPGGDPGGTTDPNPGPGPGPNPPPKPPGPDPPKPTPCETFTHAIVQSVASNPAAFPATGRALMNVAMTNPWRVAHVSSASVRTELTQYGQLNGVFHHIAFVVGAAFSDPPAAFGLMTSDAVPAGFGRKESITEFRDDVAGIKAAGYLAYGMATGNFSKAQRSITTMVCK